MVNSSGYRSSNISIVGGAPVSTETSYVYAYPPSSWSRKWFAHSIWIDISLPASSKCVIRVFYVYNFSRGVEAYYPINITVSSG